MNKKLIAGIAGLLVVLLAILVAVILPKCAPERGTETFRTEPAPTETEGQTQSTETPTQGAEDPTESTQKPTPGTEPTEPGGNAGNQNNPSPELGGTEPSKPEGEQTTPPEELPPTVVIPPDEHTGITFPCQIPEYGLVIEKMAPYSGMFVEDGTNVEIPNVAMLLVRNDGDYPVEYTRICVDYDGEKLYFDISALPVGERLVVQEKTGKATPEAKATAASATVVQRAQMDMSEAQVRVTDNGNNTITVENLTNATIPTVRVFYKYYMEEEGLFVGGIAFTVRITRLGAGAKVTLQPSHYTSQSSRVVMVLTYDSEV